LNIFKAALINASNCSNENMKHPESHKEERKGGG
jgi:hypothetical protein